MGELQIWRQQSGNSIRLTRGDCGAEPAMTDTLINKLRRITMKKSAFKRSVSLLLTLFTLLGMFTAVPLTASAAYAVRKVTCYSTNYPKGLTLTSKYPYLTYKGEIDNKKGTFGSTTVAYLDADSGTLTLNNYNLGQIVIDDEHRDLTIKLVGTNTITAIDDYGAGIMHHGDGATNITSDSIGNSLTINVASTGTNGPGYRMVYGICSYDFKNKSSSTVAIRGIANVTVKAKCTSLDGTAQAEGIKGWTVGILDDSILSVTAALTTTSNGTWGIYADSGVLINTTKHVTIDTSASIGKSVAIYVKHQVDLINAGRFTLKWNGNEFPTGEQNNIDYDKTKFAVDKSTRYTDIYFPGVNYKVTLDPNGAPVVGSKIILAVYDLPLPYTPIRSWGGYECTGYFSEKSGGIQYSNASGKSVRNWDKKSDATLYAQWKPEIYSVKVNGGTSNSGGSAAYKSLVTITAGSAPSGKVFDKWTTTSSGVKFKDPTSPNTSFDMPFHAAEVTATYKDKPASTYAVTVTNDGNGTATVSPSEAVKAGTEITLKATPNSGYKFKEWVVQKGGVTVKDNKFTMKESDVTVKAMFEKISYTATVKNGTVNGKDSGSFTPDTEVKITAGDAPSGQMFDKWTSSDVSFANADSASTSFTMPGKNVTVTATYKNKPASTYTVSVTGDGNGTAKATPSSTVAGTPIALVATPNSGYKFKEWKVESGGVTVKDNKFTMPAKDVSIKAVFEKIAVYTVTVKDGSANKAEYMAGETATITANSAPEGKAFDQWTASGVTLADPSAVSNSFAMPAKNVTVTATYKDLPADTYSVSVINDGNGKANASVSSAKAGETVTLTSKPVAGYLFRDFTVVSGGVMISKNQFTMPAENVVIEAIFEPLPVNGIVVKNGTASKTSATVGEKIFITANKAPEKQRFVRWIVSPGVTVVSQYSMNTEFYMPSKTVTLEAEYEALIDAVDDAGAPVPTYAVNVLGDGNGTAKSNVLYAKAGETVSLTAEPISGFYLLAWHVSEGDVTVKNDQFIMPEGTVTIEALFGPANDAVGAAYAAGIPGDSTAATANKDGFKDILANWWWLMLVVFVVSIGMGLCLNRLVFSSKKKKKADKTV